ncbi:MAG: exo-alpha-sialidase [Phycisphaeraceae bacterium]|nr:MAG: exo-alpha-sialidase [Phycisphaeraceae bacterium]
MRSRTLIHRLPSAALLAALPLLPAAAALAQPPIIGPQKRIDPGGGTFAANETTVSASEFNPNVIVAGWNDWRRSTASEIINSGFALSFDGGQTWTDFLLRPPPGFQTNVEGDPMTAYDDRTGALWAGALAFGGTHLYVARLNPGDTQFQPAVIARSGGGLDKCWMAAGPRLNQPNTTRLFIALNVGILWSDDMGATWSAPINLGSGLGFLPRVGPNGEVYVAYWDGGSGMRLRRSLNDSASYTDHLVATRMDVWGTQDGSRFPGQFRVPSMLYFDVDQNTGHLYACYFDTTNLVGGNRNVDIYFTKSTNQGTTWTTPVVINGDSNPPGDQFFTWLEVDKDGRIHIVFADSRHTVQNDNVINGMFDVYYMYSDDAGATWHEHRLTPQSWNSNNDGLNRSNQFMGDYFGLAAAGNRIYPVYLDTSAGDPDIFTNVIIFPENQSTLTDVRVTTGVRLAGDLDSLRNSDDVVYRTRSGFGRTFTDLHNLDMQVDGVTSVENPATIDLTIESRINQPTGAARVWLRNWNANRWDVVRNYTVGSTEGVETITGIPAASYVDNNGLIRARIRHVVTAPVFAFTFESYFDQVKMEVGE